MRMIAEERVESIFTSASEALVRLAPGIKGPTAQPRMMAAAARLVHSITIRHGLEARRLGALLPADRGADVTTSYDSRRPAISGPLSTPPEESRP